jgi:hypothetical protein
LAKVLLIYAEAFFLPLKAICYILLLIKAKAFLLIVPQSSSWLQNIKKVMAEVDEDVAVLLWYCWEKLFMGEKESVFGCIQLMRTEERKTHCRIFSRNCYVMKRNFRILQDYP